MRNDCLANFLIAGASGLLLLMGGLENAWGLLAEPPAVERYSVGLANQSTDKIPLGRIALFSGKVEIATPSASAIQLADDSLPIASSDVIKTGQDGRCRLLFTNGDLIHIGPRSLVGLEHEKNTLRINLWTGTVIAYVLPSIQARNSIVTIHTRVGEAKLKVGKFSISADQTSAILAVFDNRAEWTNKIGDTFQVTAGHLLNSDTYSQPADLIPVGLEATLTTLTSPELAEVNKALLAFRADDRQTANNKLSRVQAAFPFNGPAAYYLGLLQLDAGDLSQAIRNWKLYNQIDPAGAEVKDVPRHLTLLIREQLSHEARKALKQEEAISAAAPEPNTIAIHPFGNTGNPKDQTLGKGLAALLIADIAKVPGLKVLERVRIQTLLNEIELGGSNLSSKESAVRSGRLLRAEKIVIGDYDVRTSKVDSDEALQ